MLRFSYNLSPILKKRLAHIDSLRTRILLTPIPAKVELRLRWQATIERIACLINLSNNPLTRQEVAKLMTTHTKKRKSIAQERVFHYKQAFDVITWEWFVSNKPVTARVLRELFSLAFARQIASSESDLKQLLDYLDSPSYEREHPVVQAGVSYLQLAKIHGGERAFASLVSLLFLYKSGFDVRGLLVLEGEEKEAFADAFGKGIASENMTLWLEYFANRVEQALQRVIREIELSLRGQYGREFGVSPSFFALNERQRGILALLQQPDVTIKNRQVAKRYRVSQITASRDLAKLTTLGLLFAHGKGRSVYYTRV